MLKMVEFQTEPPKPATGKVLKKKLLGKEVAKAKG